MKLISACLLGIKCAWDGKDNHKSDKAIELLNSETLIPVCPEQLGGLKTPGYLRKFRQALVRMSLIRNARC